MCIYIYTYGRCRWLQSQGLRPLKTPGFSPYGIRTIGAAIATTRKTGDQKIAWRRLAMELVEAGYEPWISWDFPWDFPWDGVFHGMKFDEISSWKWI